MTSQLGEAFIPIRATLDKLDKDLAVARDKVDKSLEGAGKAGSDFGQKLNKALKGIESGLAAAAGAGLVFKKTFDYSREGAELSQLRDSFDLLNQNVLETPNLLDDMREAAGRTIKDTDLMAGVLKLTAGTTGEYAQTLANISPHLLEIARASNKLNPELGTTSFLYESLTTAAKRQSVPIADNLGLIIKMDSAVQKVHPSLQGLATDYDSLTQQQKFLNELLWQGDNLITQVGGDVNSGADAWARLSVKVAEVADVHKELLAERLEPVVALLAGDYKRAIEDAIAGSEDIGKTYEFASGNVALFTDANELANQKLIDTAAAVAGTAYSYKHFLVNLRLAGIEQDTLYQAMANNLDTFQMTTEEFYNISRATEEMKRKAEEAGVADAKLVNYITDTTAATDDLFESTTTISEAWTHQPTIMERLNSRYDMLRQAAEQQRQINEALVGSYQDILGGQSLLIDSYDELGTQFYTIGGRTAEQNENLAELRAEYDKTQDAIRSLQGGTAGLGLEEEELTKRLQEQQEKAAQLVEAMAPLEAIKGDIASQDVNLAFNMDAVNQVMYDSAVAAGASLEQVALLDIAHGSLSKTQAQAILIQVQVQAEANRLGDEYAAGNITIREMDQSMQDFITTLLEVPPEVGTHVSLEAQEAHDSLDRLIRKLVEFDGKTFRARAVVETEGGPPSTGGDTGGKGGGKGHALGTDGWEIVPPGFPNDTYTIGLSSYEAYAVIPDGAGYAAAMPDVGQQGGAPVNIYVDARNSRDPREVERMAERGAEKALARAGIKADQRTKI